MNDRPAFSTRLQPVLVRLFALLLGLILGLMLAASAAVLTATVYGADQTAGATYRYFDAFLCRQNQIMNYDQYYDYPGGADAYVSDIWRQTGQLWEIYGLGIGGAADINSLIVNRGLYSHALGYVDDLAFGQVVSGPPPSSWVYTAEIVDGVGGGTVGPYSIIRYGDRTIDTRGLHRHHGVWDVWLAENIPGYVRRNPDAPTILLTPEEHYATYRTMNELRQRYGYRIDWSQITKQQAYELSEEMFNAANVPHWARERYYIALDEYIERLLIGQ